MSTLDAASTAPYADRKLRCRECGDEFIFSAGEQAFFAGKGLEHVPARCASCRAILRGQRAAVTAGMQPPSESRGSRSVPLPSPRQAHRPLYHATCAACGGDAAVPFLPRGDRPVYCASCYDQHRQREPRG